MNLASRKTGRPVRPVRACEDLKRPERAWEGLGSPEDQGSLGSSGSPRSSRDPRSM